MHRALLIALFLARCAPAESPYPWFEAEWVSDADSTLAANPSLQDQDPALIEDLLSRYGELRWRVDGFMLEAVYPAEPHFNQRSRFSVEPIDADSFRLLTDSGSVFTISRNTTGFCVDPNIANQTLECFVPFGS